MATDKKPFAEFKAEPGDPRSGVLLVDGVEVAYSEPYDGPPPDDLRRAAERMNAAVDAREAVLKYSYETAVTNALTVYRMAEGFSVKDQGLLVALDQAELLGAVSGDVACGLAWDLGVARGLVEGVWGVLADALQERGSKIDPHVYPLLRALGIKPQLPLHPPSDNLSDAELRAACERRGMVFHARQVDADFLRSMSAVPAAEFVDWSEPLTAQVAAENARNVGLSPRIEPPTPGESIEELLGPPSATMLEILERNEAAQTRVWGVLATAEHPATDLPVDEFDVCMRAGCGRARWLMTDAPTNRYCQQHSVELLTR